LVKELMDGEVFTLVSGPQTRVFLSIWVLIL
jgi:hypothetical protein